MVRANCRLEGALVEVTFGSPHSRYHGGEYRCLGDLPLKEGCEVELFKINFLFAAAAATSQCFSIQRCH